MRKNKVFGLIIGVAILMNSCAGGDTKIVNQENLKPQKEVLNDSYKEEKEIISTEEFMERVINSAVEWRKLEQNKSIEDCYPFSKEIDEELKWGFRKKNGEVIVEPQFKKTYRVGKRNEYSVEKDGGVRTYDIQSGKIGRQLYESLLFCDNTSEGGIVKSGDKLEYVYINRVTGEKNVVEDVYRWEEDEKYINILHDPIEQWKPYTREGELLEDALRVKTEVGEITIVSQGENYIVYLPNGETMENVKISSLKLARHTIECDIMNKLSLEDGVEWSIEEEEYYNLIYENKIEYLGEGVFKYMKEGFMQPDSRLKLYTLENRKTGKITEEIYHNAIRIDKNRILGVTPDGIQILDNNLQIIKEDKRGYYELYYVLGDVIVGENRDMWDNRYNIYLEKDGEILWEDNMVYMGKKERKHSDFKEEKIMKYYMDNSLNTIKMEVSFKKEYERVMKYINEEIIHPIEKSEISLSTADIKGMIFHKYHTIFSEKFGNIFRVIYSDGGHIYGGGHMGGSKKNTYYITKDGEEMNVEELLLPGWEEKATKIIKDYWKKEGLEEREFDFDSIELKVGEDFSLVKNSYYSGIGDWGIHITLSEEDIDGIINKESRMYKLYKEQL